LQAIRLVRGELVRLAVVLATAASLTLALGMIFPVQFTLDTAGYRATAARTIAAIEAPVHSDDDVREALGGERVVMGTPYVTAAYAEGREIQPLSLWALSGETPDFELTLMPDSTRAAGEARDPSDADTWIDISADVAHALGVGIGDPIEVVLGPDQRPAFTVRGIYAVRESGYAGVAHVSAAAILSVDPDNDVSPTQLSTTASAEEVERMLTSDPWRKAMLEANYLEPFETEQNADRITRAEGQSVVNLSLILAISMIAFIALIAIVIGESVAILRTFHPRAQILIDLGASASSVYRTMVLTVCGTILLALSMGSGVGTLAYTTGFVGATLPPSLVPAWWIITGIAVAAGLATTAIVSARRLRPATR
jgi:hypothetical protein